MKKLKKIISVLLILSIFIINTKNLLVFADEVIIKNKVEKSVDAKPPTIDVDSLKVNKTEVRPGDTVKISIKASDDISGIRQIDIRYKRPITGSSEDISMKYNSQKGIYEGSLYIDDQTQDGLWQIEFIFLVDNKDNYGDIYNSNINRYGDNLEDLSAGDFKVIGTNADAKPPTIDVDSLKVNKTEVRPGDTVKISIKASDDISGIRQIDIRYKRPITGSSEDISMKYNSQKGIYEGSLYIDDQTQDGLWQIEFIFLVDNKDNYGYIYNSNINRYRDNLEDLSAGNFKVKNDDNTSIIVNDIKNHWASSDINNFINVSDAADRILEALKKHKKIRVDSNGEKPLEGQVTVEETIKINEKLNLVNEVITVGKASSELQEVIETKSIEEIKEIIKDFNYSDRKTYEKTCSEYKASCSKIKKDLENIGNSQAINIINNLIDEINQTYKNAYNKKNNVSSLSYIMETDEDIDLIDKIK